MIRLQAWLIRLLGIHQCGTHGGQGHTGQRWCLKPFGHRDPCAFHVLATQPGVELRQRCRGRRPAAAAKSRRRPWSPETANRTRGYALLTIGVALVVDLTLFLLARRWDMFLRPLIWPIIGVAYGTIQYETGRVHGWLFSPARYRPTGEEPTDER